LKSWVPSDAKQMVRVFKATFFLATGGAFVLCLGGTLLWAQPGAPGSHSKAPEVNQETEYRLGAGDVVEIAVWQQPDLSRICTVTEKGKIFFPPLMEISVAELTTKELDDYLTTALRKEYLKDPEVFVSIQEYNSHEVLLLGHVPRPGLFKLKGRTKLLSLLSEAGGVSMDQVGGQIVIVRTDLEKEGKDKAEHIVVDLRALLVDGDLRQNIEIQAGDRIFIPGRSQNAIYVLGEVKNPGNYPYEVGLKVFEAIMTAGGPTEDASTSRVRILRGEDQDQIRVNLSLFIKKGKMDENIPLEPGDFIIVPAGIF